MAFLVGRDDRYLRGPRLGDTVLALGCTRTHVEASGIDLEQPVAYVFEFDGGLARRVRAYLDPNQALEAVGLDG